MIRVHMHSRVGSAVEKNEDTELHESSMLGKLFDELPNIEAVALKIAGNRVTTYTRIV